MRRQFNDRAREFRRHPTLMERRVWSWLRRRYVGGLKFRRQHAVDGYILDFYCPELKLCIELDGEVHDSDARVRYDAKRSRDLQALGIAVLRLRNDHIKEQLDGAWALIVDAVERLSGRVIH